MIEDRCPSADTLAALIEGALDAEAAAAVHRHVRDCTRCRMVLAGLGAAAEEESQLAPEPLVMRPGAQVGRFRLLRMIGRGGMGTVWAATDPELGREVAIKVLLANHGGDAGESAGRSRLLREAKAMARLAHPNVVPVFETGEVSGRLFLVMELVEGQTLAAWLREKHPLPQVLEQFIAAGQGLAAAHAAGVIHRDFKPDNVLVGNDGRARVTDFGLARGQLTSEAELALEKISASPAPDSPAEIPGEPALEEAALPSPLTPIGALLGTPAYMSPEQMRGQLADARSDLFAWCTALFEAIYGVRPYPAKTLLDTRKQIDAGLLAWPRSPRIPRWLRRELQQGLRANPLERQESIDALLASVRRGRAADEHRWLWFAAGAVLLVVAGATLLGILRKPISLRAQPRALAVLSPRNASPNADAAWIAPVLSELIASDLAGDPMLQLIPGSEVAAATGDLELRGASPIASDLPRLRTRLGAELVLGGKYTLAGDKLKCELALWDPKGNATLLSEDGDTAHLADLGARLSGDVRRALGMKAQAAPGAATIPTNVAAARLYAEGLQLLRSYQPARAIEPLQKAAVLAPDNPRVQLALVDAYNTLRIDGPARSAAQRAYEAKGSLSPAEQAHAEILYRRSIGDGARAVELATARHQANPSDLRLGLELGDELIAASKWHELLDLTAEMHRLPSPAGSDARIDLDEMTGCNHIVDFKCSIVAGDRGYASAKARGARWQMALARFGSAQSVRKLGDPAKALTLLDESEQLYNEVGDQGGAAGARSYRATILADRGDLIGARAQFEAALQTFEQLGDRAGEGMQLHNLSVLLRRARDLPGAISYASRATTVNLELGATGPAASSMQTLGNLRLDMGDLAGASEAFTKAIEIRRKEKSPQLVSVLTSLSLVRLEQGDLAGMRKLLEEAAAADNHQEKVTSGRLAYFTAQLAFAERRADDTIAGAETAIALYKQAGLVDEEALAEVLLANVMLVSKRIPEARAAIDRASALVAKGSSQLAHLPIAITAARVQAAEHPQQIEEALKPLRALAAEAAKIGSYNDEWSAKVTIGELEMKAHKPGAKEHLLQLARDARTQGFIDYATSAEEAAAGK